MRRIFTPQNGAFIPTDFIVDDRGEMFFDACEKRSYTKAELLRIKNHLVIMNYETKAPIGVQLAETASGQVGTLRAEKPGTISGARRPLKIVLDNTGASAATFVVGDGFGLYALKNTIAAKPATVTVAGTYGGSTLTLLAEISKSNALDLHGYHLVNNTSAGAASEGFFTSGMWKQFAISPDMQSVKEIEVPVSDEVTQAANKDNIRANDNYRFHLDGFTGWLVTLPAGEKITLTFRSFNAIGRGRLMQLMSEM